MAEDTLLLVNKVHTQMSLSGSSSQLDTLIMIHCCRHNLWDKYDKQNHSMKEIYYVNYCQVIKILCFEYLVAVLAFITENWRLSTISAAKTSRTIQTLIRNGK